MDMVKLTIDSLQVEVPKGTTILAAAKKCNIDIPTLCFHPDQEIKANCRVCVVEVEGQRVLQPACAYPVGEGMVVHTNTSIVRESRKIIVELLLAHHSQDCLNCDRNQNCELQSLAYKLNIKENRFPIVVRDMARDTSSYSVIRDPAKCILCGRCVYACSVTQTVHALAKENRGFDTIVTPSFGKPLGESVCINCGQCVLACPVGALVEKDDTQDVWDVLSEKDKWDKMLCTYDSCFLSSDESTKKRKWTAVQTAPAVRIGLGEAFGMPAGSISTGKMVAALRRLGFDAVFDTDFTADLTILEEGNELLERLQHGGTLPMITSCSPGWIKFCEQFYPDFIPNLSSCKSPQQMFGALLKTYYADKIGKNSADIFSVSIMPCTAKKFECKRPEMQSTDSGFDIDVVLTVRELAKMIREAGINWDELDDEEFDLPFGIGSGAGEIFGASGGVMEAALRTVYEVVTGDELQHLDFEGVRGFDGIKEATVDLKGTEVKVAVVNSLGSARKLLDAIRAGEKTYHFIEVMACPGGCIGGGGQPIPATIDVRLKRMAAVYEEDKNMCVRQSHKNPVVDVLYKEFLGKPLGEKSHHLLHTHYTRRNDM